MLVKVQKQWNTFGQVWQNSKYSTTFAVPMQQLTFPFDPRGGKTEVELKETERGKR